MSTIISELFIYNRSTLFLLGTVGLNNVLLKEYGLCNCYLRDENKPEYEGTPVLFLLFDIKNNDKFRYFVNMEKVRTPLFIDEYDYDDRFVVLVYEIPDKFLYDLELFMKGQYSRFSQALINTLPKEIEVMVNGRREKRPSIQHMIINKDPEFVGIIEEDLNHSFAPDDEIWSIPDMNEESITIPPKKRIK